jgi:hypothetical protein
VNHRERIALVPSCTDHMLRLQRIVAYPMAWVHHWIFQQLRSRRDTCPLLALALLPPVLYLRATTQAGYKSIEGCQCSLPAVMAESSTDQVFVCVQVILETTSKEKQKPEMHVQPWWRGPHLDM